MGVLTFSSSLSACSSVAGLVKMDLPGEGEGWAMPGISSRLNRENASVSTGASKGSCRPEVDQLDPWRE